MPEPSARADNRWREPSSWELIDLRTSEVVIDSVEAEKVASERPFLSVHFRGMGTVLRVEGGEAFAVAQGRLGWPYALMSLESPSEVWRIVYASGGMSVEYDYRVDYTGDLVRVEIKAGQYGRSIVVEGPRSRGSSATVSIIHPGADMLTDALRSGSRLRTTVPAGSWLGSFFDKTSLPIVLRPFYSQGLGIERRAETASGASSSAARFERGPAAVGTAREFELGPAEECEVDAGRVVCSGGESGVIGEESPYPWRVH